MNKARIPKAVTEWDPNGEPKKKCINRIQEDVNKYGLHSEDKLKWRNRIKEKCTHILQNSVWYN